MFNRLNNLPRALVVFICLYVAHNCLLATAFALEVPPLHGRVNDTANLLSGTTETQIDHLLTELEQTDSTQIVVLTIPSLKGDNLEQFSLKVAETWQIGQAEFDNGALLLIAVNDRKVRIEVGYGLEGKLTDLLAGRIIRNVILPRFKQGNFDQGAIEGITAMVQAVRGEYTATQSRKGQRHDDYFGLIALLMFFIFFVGNMLRTNKAASAAVCGIGAPIIGMVFQGFSFLLLLLIPIGVIGGFLAAIFQTHQSSIARRRRTYLGSGGFGSSSGGFGGFSGGGGGFGGGGASGGW